MKTLLLVIAWAWIAVPLGWGVYQSVQKSLPLFDGVASHVHANVADMAPGGYSSRTSKMIVCSSFIAVRPCLVTSTDSGKTW